MSFVWCKAGQTPASHTHTHTHIHTTDAHTSSFADSHKLTHVWPLTLHPISFLVKINEPINSFRPSACCCVIVLCVLKICTYLHGLCLCVCVCLSVFLSVCLSVCLRVCVCVGACVRAPASLSVCRPWHSVPVYDAHIYVSGMSDPERICQRP